MHAMAKALLEWETIDADQIDDIMDGKPPRPPKDWTPSRQSSAGGTTPPVEPDGAPRHGLRPDVHVFHDGASAPFLVVADARMPGRADAASRSTCRARG